MRNKITRLFLLVLGFLLLTPSGLSAQQVGGDYERVGAQSPRQYLHQVQDLQKRYPLLEYLPGSPRQYVKAGAKSQSGTRNVVKLAGMAAPTTPTLYGSVISSGAWGEYDIPAYGMYSVPLETADTSEPVILGDDEIEANGSGVLIGDNYNWISFTKYRDYRTYYYSAPTDTWVFDKSKSVSNNYISTDIAYDENTGAVIACSYNDEFTGFELVRYDFDGFSRRVIKNLGSTRYVGLAFSNEGVLYGIRPDGNLYIIDTTTGEAAKVGSLGVEVSSYTQSATFDPATDKLYFSYLLNANDAGLYEIDTTTGKATLVTRYANNEQIVGIFIPMTASPAAAPAAPTNLAASFEGNETDGSLTFTLPTTTHDGSALTGSLDYFVDVNGTQAAQGSDNAGATVTVPLTVEDGMTRFSVYASNDNGKGDVATLRQWIGYDAPSPVSDIIVNFDKDGKASISWTAPTTGIHGKDLDASGLTYDVLRLPDSVVVVNGTNETSITDQLPEADMTKYAYSVTPVHHGVIGESATSNYQVYGSHFSVPYQHSFAGSNALDFFKVIDANDDGTTWEVNDDKTGIVYSPSRWNQGDADDWIIAPALGLSNDRTYGLTVDMSLDGFSQTEILSAMLGNDTTTDAMTGVIFKDSVITGRGDKSITIPFRVEQNGDYNIGLHLTSTDDGSTVTLKNFAVKVEALDDAPAAVSDFTVTPDANGGLSAVVSLTAPSLNSVGGNLTGLQSVTVVRDDSVLVGTQNATNGQKITMNDTGMTNGTHTYKAYATSEAGDGFVSTVSAFIGVDIPNMASNVVLKETGDGEINLSWGAPTIGANGGYINSDQLDYTILRSDNKSFNGEKGKTSFNDAEPTVSSDRQDELFYLVTASNEAGSSERARSNSITVGDPDELPFVEHFADYGPDNSGWRSYNYGKGRFTTPYRSGVSADGDNHSAIFTPRVEGDSSDYISSKINIQGARKPGVHFSYYAYPGTDASLKVMVEANQNGDVRQLAKFDFKNMTGSEGWRDTTLLITGMGDSRYIQLHFLATSKDLNTPVAIDAIEVRDQVEHNISAQLSVNDVLTAGQPNEARVTVNNNGTEIATDFTVELYAADSLVSTVPGVNIAPGKDSTYVLSWTPAITDTGKVALHAVANFASDEYPADNTTEPHDVTIEFPQYPSVNISGNFSTDGVTLDWSKPELATEEVTEDFDEYEPWQTTGFGNWTTVDEDGGMTYGFSGFSWSFQEMAWMVMNSDSLVEHGLWSETNPLTGHSGSQYLASFSTNYMEAINNADWLISPNISSQNPNITFWARRVNNNNEKEWLAVKYSTTDKRTSSFMPLPSDTVITDLTTTWQEYTFDLPEGTKYFALENVGVTIGEGDLMPFAIFIDDLSYTPVEADLDVEGYRIYRDGKLIATVGADATSYIDADASDGKQHTYQVTVVYNLGESALSNAFTVITSGINAIAAQNGVFVKDGHIEVVGADGKDVTIFTLGGARIASSNGSASLSVAPGAYLVKIGNKAVKVVVK